MNTVDILNLNVGRLCNERGWSQKKLAKETGMLEAALSRALSGNPQLKTIERIAKALDVSVKSLFENPDDMEGYVVLHGRAYHFNSKDELDYLEKHTHGAISGKVSL